MVFDEDDARSRKNHAPENLAVIRRLALGMLSSHPDTKSTSRKMKIACWRQAFFFELSLLICDSPAHRGEGN